MVVILLCVIAVQPLASSEEKSDISALETQVKQVLDNQEKILASLEEIKKELQVVKIRASLK